MRVSDVPKVRVPKERLLAERVGLGPLPVPDRLKVCEVEFTPLSAMVNVPESEPGVTGWKVTVIVQEPLAASEVPQVLVWLKSAVAPVIAMLLIVKAALPVLFKVIGWVAGEPSDSAGKLMVGGVVGLNAGVVTTFAPRPVPVTLND